mgnify:CR=1 FL=1
MIVTSKEMVLRARQGGYAVPAINVQGGNYDIIRAICDAAEEMHSPIILDDLGAEMKERSEQGWISELLFEIVQTRYERELPTIITTNLTLGELSQRYGERTASRLYEMCVVTWAEGFDFRLGVN